MKRLVVLLSVLACAVTLAPPSASASAPPSGSAASPAAVRLQQRLNALGCDAGRADGRADRHRRTAVIRFQAAAHLEQTGHLDRRTRARLTGAKPPRCDARPVPAHSGSGRRIVVSQRQNYVWLVGPRGGVAAQGPMVDNTRVLRPGKHAVGSYCGRAARIKRNQDYGGGLWLDDFVRFAPCGIGFHRVPRHKSDGRQIHPDWLLGTDLEESHGCLRLSKQLADRVWDFTARPTPVRVV